MPALALILTTATTARVGAFDPDTETAIAAVEATGTTLTGVQKDAANAFIVTLKAASIWTKFTAAYLFIGGTAAAHAINWKDPGTYIVAWVGSPTHSANGVQFNGASYGDTGIFGLNAEVTGLAAYVNVLNTVDTAFTLIGAQDDGMSLDASLSFASDNTVTTMIGDQMSRTGETMPARDTGFIFGGRPDGITINQRVSETDYAYTSTAPGTATPDMTLYIGALNLDDAPTQHGNGRLAMAGILDSALDAAELAILDTATTTLQTALSRA